MGSRLGEAIGNTFEDLRGSALKPNDVLAGTAHNDMVSDAKRAHVSTLGGAPALWVDAKPVPAIGYVTYLPDRGSFHSFSDLGYNLFFVAAYMGDRGVNSDTELGSFRPGMWVSRDRLDPSPLEEDLARVVAAAPDAHVIVRVNLDVPTWWDALHPDELTLLRDGSRMRQSMASLVWRRQVEEQLKRLIGMIASGPFAGHVIGYHVAAGRTEEWGHHGFTNSRLPDYSEPSVAGFRRWLRHRYTTDGALQEAWRDTTVTLETVTIPPAQVRLGNEDRHLRTTGDQQVVDYSLFHSWIVADAVCAFCRAVKEASRGRLLAGAFYGYGAETTHVDVGQHAVWKVLHSPDVDFLCSPNSYHRRLGGDWPFFTMTDSVKRHGKLWFTEADTRTHRTRPLGDVKPEIVKPGTYRSQIWQGPVSAEEVLGLLENNLARVLATGSGLWWFDMWGGWFDDPAFKPFFRRARRLMEEALAWTHRDSCAEVAVFIDDESYAWAEPSSKLMAHAVRMQRFDLARIGAPYDLYHVRDAAVALERPYKVLIFLNLLSVTDDTAMMLDRLRAGGRWLVWVYAPGFCNGGVEQATDLTGVRLEEAPKAEPLRIQVNQAAAAYLGLPACEYGMEGEARSPVLYIADPGALVWGRLSSSALPALGAVHHDTWTSVFSTAPRLPATLVRALCRKAGVHVYNEADDVFYANHHFFSVHTDAPGSRTVRLPRPRQVTDALTGECIAQRAEEITFEMAGNTRLFLQT